MEEKQKIYFGLYWLQDGDEDWFVIAPKDEKGWDCGHIAEHFHDNYEGHDPNIGCDSAYYFSSSDWICDVPEELLGRLTTSLDLHRDGTYLDKSKENYKKFVADYEENKKDFMVDFSDMFNTKFINELKNSDVDIENYDDIMEHLWGCDYGSSDSIMKILSDGHEHSTHYVAALMLEWNEAKYCVKGYGAFHGQIDILKELDGFTIVDDGKISSQRVVAYDGNLYTEGEMESKIAAAIRGMSIIAKQDPSLN